MVRKRTIIFVFLAGLILLISGFGSSYYWLTKIYLPEQIDSNKNAKLLNEWILTDTFIPPSDGKITRNQLDLFIKVNSSLSFLLRKIRRQFEEYSWRIAFDIIQMQPEWAANKYLALKKFNLSPKEYDWIADQVLEFWIFRWKEESVAKLKEYGWELNSLSEQEENELVNYDIFIKNEKELNKIFSVLSTEMQAVPDSSAVN
jgi:hypothetical protein